MADPYAPNIQSPPNSGRSLVDFRSSYFAQRYPAGDTAFSGTAGSGNALNQATDPIPVRGRNKLTYQLDGTFAAQVTVNKRINGRAWVQASQQTAPGMYDVDLGLADEIQFKITTYTSGAVICEYRVAQR